MNRAIRHMPLLAALGILCAGPARAATGIPAGAAARSGGGLPCRYLTPDRFATPSDAELILRIEETGGAGRRAVSWPADSIRRYFVRSLAAQENRDTVPAAPGRSDGAVVRLTHAGMNMIGVDFHPRLDTIAAAELRQLRPAPLSRDEEVALAGLPEDRPVRVRRIESCKAFVRVEGDEPYDSTQVATGKSGQAVEIRLLANPALVPVGGDLPIRVYVDGDKCGGVVVRAVHADTGVTRECSVSEGGFANLTISASGVWRVEFTKAAPAEAGDKAEADWILWTATVTFEAAAVERKDGGR